MNVLHDMVFAGMSLLREFTGSIGLYVRGDVELAVTVIEASQQHAANLIGVIALQADRVNLMVARSELEDLVLPEPGDRVTYDVGGRERTVELRDDSSGESNWRYLPGNEFALLSMTVVSDLDGQPVSHPAALATTATEAATVMLVETIQLASLSGTQHVTAQRLTRVLTVSVQHTTSEGLVDVTDSMSINHISARSIAISTGVDLQGVQIILEGV